MRVQQQFCRRGGERDSGLAAVEMVTHRCFTTLGVPPLMGRVFTAEEAPASRPGTRVVVIGYDLAEGVRRRVGRCLPQLPN